MGLFPSYQKVTRLEVEDLKGEFEKLSRILAKHSLKINVARFFGCVFALIGAVSLFLRSVTVFPGGRDYAAALISLGLCLHVISSWYRWSSILTQFDDLVTKFEDIVPAYMDISSVRGPKVSTPSPTTVFKILVDACSFFMFMIPNGEDFNFWLLALSLVILVVNVMFLRKVVMEEIDSLVKKICQICISTLDKLLTANADP